MGSIVFVVLVASGLIVVAAMWARSRDKQSPAARIPDAHADESVNPRGNGEVGAAFDPSATRIYQQPLLRPRPGVAVAHTTGAVIASGRLVCLSGCHKGMTFPVDGPGIIAGRNPSCDIVLTDSRVSSRHAWIGITNGKAMLRDLASTNGTFLNAQANSPVVEAELRSGDMVSFGGHQGEQFRFIV